MAQEFTLHFSIFSQCSPRPSCNAHIQGIHTCVRSLALARTIQMYHIFNTTKPRNSLKVGGFFKILCVSIFVLIRQFEEEMVQQRDARHVVSKMKPACTFWWTRETQPRFSMQFLIERTRQDRSCSRVTTRRRYRFVVSDSMNRGWKLRDEEEREREGEGGGGVRPVEKQLSGTTEVRLRQATLTLRKLRACVRARKEGVSLRVE